MRVARAHQCPICKYYSQDEHVPADCIAILGWQLRLLRRKEALLEARLTRAQGIIVERVPELK